MLQAADETEHSAATPPLTVGARIRMARQFLGLTQHEAAKKIKTPTGHVSENTLSRWERDEIEVKKKYHDELCRVLNMRLSDFNPY